MKLLVIKNTSRTLNIFTRKNKRCYVSFPMLYIWPLLSRGHQRAWIKWFATVIWPLESETLTYSIAKENKIFFVVKMFAILIITFIIKLYSRVIIFTKYCILVSQNFPPSKMPGYAPLKKWSEHFLLLEYDGWEMLYDKKKRFSLKLSKKWNKKAENKQ